MSRRALQNDCRVNWTRWDYVPLEAKCGHIEKNVPHVAPFVSVFAFNGAYPSAIIFGNISPENCIVHELSEYPNRALCSID